MKNTKRMASLVLMLVCGLAQAGDWEDGYAAYERQDYKTAVKLWRKVADTGDSSGQSILGAMYAQGQGVPQDYVESIKWYRLAAAQGEPKAQSKLGFMYANAQGTERDHLRAYVWSSLAVIAGQKEAIKVRDASEKTLSLEQFATAKRLVRDCPLRKYKNCN
jgi:TPR repeat protein